MSVFKGHQLEKLKDALGLTEGIGIVASLTGTANQVLVDGTTGTPQTGSLILSLPQDISTSSSPTFDGLTLNYAIYSAGGANSLLGWLNVGTTTDATTQGSFATGLTGASRFFFNASVGDTIWYGTGGNLLASIVQSGNSSLIRGYDSTGTVVNQISAVTLTGTVFNETGVDIDFRIEGATDANLLFIDAGTDRVGIGTTGPDRKLDVLDGTGTPQMRLTYTDAAIYSDFELDSIGVLHIRTFGGSLPIIYYDQSRSGAFLRYQAANTSNTAGSDSGFYATVAGLSAGDPIVLYEVGGVLNWVHGIDNSDADKFKISGSGTLGTNDYLTITTGGATTIHQWLNVGTATSAVAQGNIAGNVVTVESSGNAYIRFLHTATTEYGIGINTALADALQIVGVAADPGSGTPYLTIRAGNVGINTTGPDRKLDVLDGTGNPQMRLTYTDGTVYTDFQVTSAGDTYLSGSATSPEFRVSGTTNPFIVARSTTGSIISKLQSTNGFGGLVGTESNHQFAIYSNNTAQITIASTGATTITQWLNVGTATDATAQGDFASGLTGGNRLVYTQSVALLSSTGSSPFLRATTLSGATDATLSLFKTGTREWRIATSGSSLVMRDESGALDVVTLTAATGATTIHQWLNVGTATDAAAQGDFAAGLTGSAYRIFYDQSDGILYFRSATGIVNTISAKVANTTIFNNANEDIDFRIGSTQSSSQFFVDSSLGRVGIGTPGPDASLDILSTSTQLRLTYTDGTVYSDINTLITGDLEIRATGDELIWTQGRTTGIYVVSYNSNNANAGAHGAFIAQVGGTSGGDPYFYCAIIGGADWSFGPDNSDLDKFKVSEFSSLGTNDRFTIATGGLFTHTNNSVLTDAVYYARTSVTARTWGHFINSDGTFNIRDVTGSNTIITIDLNGLVGIGTTGPDAKLDILSTATQLRLTYTDGSVYTDFTTSSGGLLYIAPTGFKTLLEQTNAGGTVDLQVTNLSAAASSDARFVLQVGAETSGDPFIRYIIGAVNWSSGIDNDDSNKYKISNSSALGTNDYLTITTAGVVSIPLLTAAHVLYAGTGGAISGDAGLTYNASQDRLIVTGTTNTRLTLSSDHTATTASIEISNIGTGDATTSLTTGGVTWTYGNDQSIDNRFALAVSTILGAGTDVLRISTSGAWAYVGQVFSTGEANEFTHHDFNLGGGTITFTTGALLATNRAVRIRRPLYAADAPTQTITNAATVYIENSPSAGTNVAITNPYALWVDDGAVRFDGWLNVGTTTSAVAQGDFAAGTTNALFWDESASQLRLGGTNSIILWTSLGDAYIQGQTAANQLDIKMGTGGLRFLDNPVTQSLVTILNSGATTIHQWLNVGVATSATTQGQVGLSGNLLFDNTPSIRTNDGGLIIDPRTGNTSMIIYARPNGTQTVSSLFMHGQNSLSVGTRGEFFQSGANTVIRNQSLGGGSNGTITLEHDGAVRLTIATTGATTIHQWLNVGTVTTASTQGYVGASRYIQEAGGTAIQGVLLFNNNNTNLRYSDIRSQFASSDASFSGVIRFLKYATGGNFGSAIEFHTEEDTGSQNFATRLGIYNKGVVVNQWLNIGTATAATQQGEIATQGSVNGYLNYTFQNSSAGTGAVSRIQLGNDSSPGSGQIVIYGSAHSTKPLYMEVANANNAPLSLQTNGLDRLFITGAGNVGIGTTNPLMQLSNTDTTDGISGVNTTGLTWKSLANEWGAVLISRPVAGNSYTLRLHTGGTTSSDYGFAVSSGAGAGTFIFDIRGTGATTIHQWLNGGLATGATAQGDIAFGNDSGTYIFLDESAGVLLFNNNTATTSIADFRIDSGSASGARSLITFRQDATDKAYIYTDVTDTSLNIRPVAGYDLNLWGEGEDSRIVVGASETVINENGLARNTRAEGDTLPYHFWLDATATTENAAFFATAAPNWQTMDRGLFIGDASTVPTGNPTAGGFMYSEAGAGKWRGSGGTITTFGPAEPHCPTCGRDFMHEWENAETGYLAVCMSCLAEELGDRSWILRKKIT